MHSSLMRAAIAVAITALATTACLPRDSDGDGIADDDDNCPAQHNASQNDFDGDGFGDACDDFDNDGIRDADDNCRMVANREQLDTDTDGAGDVCDDDLDGDGIDNDGDICPQIADPGQFDEDRDGIGDPCDNCPTVANSGQENEQEGAGMADGVGDACDPRPTETGDSIAYFSGFGADSPGLPEGWSVFEGAGHHPGLWSVSDGRLVQASTTHNDPTSLLPDGTRVTGDGVLIETVVTVDVLPGGADASVALVAAYSSIGADGYECALATLSGALTRLTLTELTPGGDGSQDNVQGWDLAQGQTYRLDQYLYADTSISTFCQAIEQQNQNGHSLGHTDTDDNRPTPNLAVRTVRAAASFDYVLAYSLGGPLPCNPPEVCF